MHSDPKRCSCPDDFPPQSSHKLCAREFLRQLQPFISGRSLVFLSPGFRSRISTVRCHSDVWEVWWEYEEGETKAHLGSACYSAARSRGGMQTEPVLLYTSSGLALQATQMCTQVSDTHAYFRHTHSSKFSSTDYLWNTRPSRKKFWCMLCWFMCKVCLSYISLICSLSLIVPHLLPLVVLCIIGVCGVPALLGMQLDSRTCKHRIRTVCMKLP